MANTTSYAGRAVTTTGETFTKLTVSFWMKGMAHPNGSVQRGIWGLNDNSDSNRFFTLYFSTNGSLYAYWKQNEGVFFTLGTTQKFRDPFAWQHFHMVMDTTLSNSSDRVKFYLNGVRITSFEDDLGTLTQNAFSNILINTDGRMWWGGSKTSGTFHYFDGSLSHCHMCVGYAYQADSFGSVDTDSGVWKINTSPSVSYGTNGGWWFKDNASTTDNSTNSNTLATTSGNILAVKDNPSNNFAVINALNPGIHGNCTVDSGFTSILSTDAAHRNGYSTFPLAIGNGKFYWETKVDRKSSHIKIGVVYDEWAKINQSPPNEEFSGDSKGYSYRDNGLKENNGTASFGDTFTAGDIIGTAFDTENRKLYFSKNGVWQNSGDPTSGATGTGAAFTVADGYTYLPAINVYNADFSCNFGSGFFDTTAITTNSGNGYAGAEGASKFNYSVPSGYSAINTKGLNQ